MPNLIYFTPKTQTMGQAKAALDKAGLGYVRKVKPNYGQGAGPGGGGGSLVGVPDARGEVDLHRLRYAEAGQTWLRVPGSDVVMVGCWDDAPPLPEDLARKTQVEGHWVTLGDGRKWLVPAARHWQLEDGEPRWLLALPTKRTVTPEGKWVEGPVAARFRDLWDRVVRITESEDKALQNADESALDWLNVDVQCGLVVDALAVNYRVGPAEVALLGLLQTGIFLAVLDALNDKPTLKGLLGKKAEASGEASTSPGAEG